MLEQSEKSLLFNVDFKDWGKKEEKKKEWEEKASPASARALGRHLGTEAYV